MLYFQLPLSGSLVLKHGWLRIWHFDFTFNSLSRDHSCSRPRFFKLSTVHFQLPLSGSLYVSATALWLVRNSFNSLSRDHSEKPPEITESPVENFQLPLSGSRRRPRPIPDRPQRFQLPLSGSQFSVLQEMRGSPRTFNSLSRDHTLKMAQFNPVGPSFFQLPLSGSH